MYLRLDHTGFLANGVKLEPFEITDYLNRAISKGFKFYGVSGGWQSFHLWLFLSDEHKAAIMESVRYQCEDYIRAGESLIDWVRVVRPVYGLSLSEIVAMWTELGGSRGPQ